MKNKKSFDKTKNYRKISEEDENKFVSEQLENIDFDFDNISKY